MAEPGDVLAANGGLPFERHEPNLNEAVREAGNPGRLNRTSIVPFEASPYLRSDFLNTKGYEKHLSDFDISLVPADDVQPLLQKTDKEASETAEKQAFETRKQLAIKDLEGSVVKLRKNVSLLRQGRKQHAPGSAKKVRALRAHLSKAKKVLREARKLEGLEKTARKNYSIPSEKFQSGIQTLSSEAKEHVSRLKTELGRARADKKAVDKHKADLSAARTKAKKLKRQGQRAIDRQLRNDQRQDRLIQRRQEVAGKHKASHLPSSSATQASRKNRNIHYQASPATVTPKRRTLANAGQRRASTRIGSHISPVQTTKVNMKQFLAGIKPSSGLSVKKIEDRIWAIKTRDDFKQVLVDMRAAKLDLKTYHRLRSLINAGLCGFMRDDKKFETLDSVFVAHVINMGDNREEAIKEFTKAAARLGAKLSSG